MTFTCDSCGKEFEEEDIRFAFLGRVLCSECFRKSSENPDSEREEDFS